MAALPSPVGTLSIPQVGYFRPQTASALLEAPVPLTALNFQEHMSTVPNAEGKPTTRQNLPISHPPTDMRLEKVDVGATEDMCFLRQ